MAVQFRALYDAMNDALTISWLEIRAQRALLALLENRLTPQERQFWLHRADLITTL